MELSAPELPKPGTALQRDASTEAFEFVRELALELSDRSVELPSFPDIALQVQKVLSDANASSERVVRVLGAEPMLATRVLSMANSAALSPGGKPVTELRAAVTRLGFDALRAAVIGFAVSQLRKARTYKGIERHLNVLWQHSVLVSSMAFVVARHTRKMNADTAMLAGLVHGVGKLYILTHAVRHPVLFGDQAMYQRIVRDWHGNIAKALLESWNMAEEVVTAVHACEDPERECRGANGQLADALAMACLLAACKDSPDLLTERLRNEAATDRLGLDFESCQNLIRESTEELAALRQALEG